MPSANIGLWPGPSGLVVIDLDGAEGEATGQRCGLLSEPTLVVISGRVDGDKITGRVKTGGDDKTYDWQATRFARGQMSIE